MSGYLFLVPVSLALGLIALAAFLWSLRREQYDDLDGAAERILFADDRPILERETDADGARECASTDESAAETGSAPETGPATESDPDGSHP